jgi:membrane associated rhomboid family serine protease
MHQRYERPGSPPFFTAPDSVVWLAGIIVALHALRLVVPEEMARAAEYHFALIPQRLDLMLVGGANNAAYSWPGALAACIGHVFLHADWMHVLLNTLMLLALGAPVARRLGARGFYLLFFVSAFGGAMLFFAVRLPDGPPAVGASGGVSGIVAGALLLMANARGGWASLVRADFLKTSAAFLIANVLLALFGPALFGAGIAWDAHVGGYLVGAVFMAGATQRG